MRQVWIAKAGRPEVLEVREAPDPLPGAGQVRIRVEAAGVNFADIMARLGAYPAAPPIPCVVGFEVSGTVDAVGDGVSGDWAGRGVIGLTHFGGYADTVCVDLAQVVLRPHGMSAIDAAAIPVNYVTAWDLMVVAGSLRPGDTVLIHSAGGGVGVAAVQLARHIGAHVIGTASPGKHQRLREMGVEHCIDGRTDDFEARVREITGGRGVQLILDAVGGDSLKKGLRSLAPGGRIGCFGYSSGTPGKQRSLWSLLKMFMSTPIFAASPAKLLQHNRGFFGVNLGPLRGSDPIIAQWLNEVLPLFADGALAPLVCETFPLEAAAAAHHFIQDRKNFGKVVLVP